MKKLVLAMFATLFVGCIVPMVPVNDGYGTNRRCFYDAYGYYHCGSAYDASGEYFPQQPMYAAPYRAPAQYSAPAHRRAHHQVQAAPPVPSVVIVPARPGPRVKPCKTKPVTRPAVVRHHR
ncbi:MAG: hypothetical protein AAB348_00655 [Patescibacteria group bacterium]